MGISLNEALTRRRSVRDFSEKAIDALSLRKLLWAAQGVSGDNGRKTVPSAHSLYPLRLFVVSGRIDELNVGLYSVKSETLGLEAVHSGDLRFSLRSAAIGEPEWVAKAACIIVICADLASPLRAFADQSRDGVRGARYAYMEAGAATQNIQLQAVEEGLGSVWVGGFNDDAIAEVLDLQGSLTPLILLCVGDPVSKRSPD